MRVSRPILSTLLLATCLPAIAGSLISSMPVARIYPNPGGILFPGFSVAAGVNPAAIPTTGRNTAIQVAGTPSLQSGDPSLFFGSVATTKGPFGMGAGYTGVLINGRLVNGGFVGMGYNFDPVSVGLSVRDPDISGRYTGVDAGFIFETKSEITFGAVLYDINNTAQADLGVGTKAGKKYNLEANVLFPPFNNLGGGYVGTLSASIFPGAVGFHFGTSYFTAFKSWQYIVGVGAYLSDKINVTLQYASARQATAALTVIL